MAVREILRYGDPRLVAVNQDVVDFSDPSLSVLVQDLFETCWAAPGLGLAAPQIGVNLRVAVIDLSVGKDPAKAITVINPTILSTRGRVRDSEGCLSFPGIEEIIERPEEVVVEALNVAGTKVTHAARDFLARAFCHEIDHLDATLFIERMSALKRGFVTRKIARRRKKGRW